MLGFRGPLWGFARQVWLLLGYQRPAHYSSNALIILVNLLSAVIRFNNGFVWFEDAFRASDPALLSLTFQSILIKF